MVALAEGGGRIGRGPAARARVLDAAMELLAEAGWRGCTMEAVAARAGASKATVYRHWPTRAALVLAAAERVSAPLPVPGTGDVRSDLVALVGGLVDAVRAPSFGAVLTAVADAAEHDAAVAARHAELAAGRRRPVVEAVEAAVDRGELPAHTDVDLLVDLVAAPVFYRRFITHAEVTPAWVEHLVDAALAAATAAAVTRWANPGPVPR